jgi:hypothetical protein
MSHSGKSKKVGKSAKKKMYGTRKLLVCGYSDSDQQALLSLLEDNGLKSVPVIFVTTGDIQKIIKDVLDVDDRYGEGEISEMRRAVVASGLTQKELHVLMTTYRKAKLPVQLWAALTPTSEKWTVAALLEELAEEDAAIKKLKK